jgi:hypothetical protein
MWHSIGEEGVLASARAEHRTILRAADIHHPAIARSAWAPTSSSFGTFLHDHPFEETVTTPSPAQ